MALAAFATGGFWGNSLPRRFRAASWQGVLLASALVVAIFAAALLVVTGAMRIQAFLLNPP